MYNMKTLQYADGSVQSRFYSHPVYTGKKKKGESTRVYLEEPFTGETVEEVWDFSEFEKREERARQVSRNRTIQKIYNYARANEWEFFVTLTFNRKKVDRFDYSACQRALTSWLNHLKRDFPDMRYLMVPELHLGENSEVNENGDHAWHFHGLVSGISDCMEFGGHFTKKGNPIYNIGNYALGWSTATEVQNQEACCKYITKYITKDLAEVTKGRKRYWASRNLDLPVEEEYILSAECAETLVTDLKRTAKSFKELEVNLGLEKRTIVYVESESLDMSRYRYLIDPPLCGYYMFSGACKNCPHPCSARLE